MKQSDKLLFQMWKKALKAAINREDWKNAAIYKREVLKIVQKYE